MGVLSGSWECAKCHFWWSHTNKCLFCGMVNAFQPIIRNADEIRVHGPLPPSLSYLHSLAANGQGDNYDWANGEITVEICDTDRRREQSLNPVAKVVLNYK